MRRYITGFALASLFVLLQAAPATAAIKMIEFKSGTNLLVCSNPKCVKTAHVQRGETTTYIVYGDNVDWATSVAAGSGITVTPSELGSAWVQDQVLGVTAPVLLGHVTLKFTVDATAAPGNRTVTINWRNFNPFGNTGKETFTITVLRNPDVTSVTPTTVTSGRTTQLTISGSDLGAAKISLQASATSMPITSNTENRIVVSGTWPTIFRQKTDVLRIGQQASVLLSLKAADIVILPDTVVATYLGCYVDTATRVLNGYTFVSTTAMTNQLCQQTCKSHGFKYAGTEYANQCFCGNTAPTQSAASQECGTSCSGAPGEICGGTWRLSVYRWP